MTLRDWLMLHFWQLFDGIGTTVAVTVVGFLGRKVLKGRRDEAPALPPSAPVARPAPPPAAPVARPAPPPAASLAPLAAPVACEWDYPKDFRHAGLPEGPPVFLRESPDAIVAFLKTAPPLSVPDLIAGTYVGRWLRFDAEVSDVTKRTLFRGEEYYTVGLMQGRKLLYVVAYFPASKRGEIEHLRRDDCVRVEAQISAINSMMAIEVVRPRITILSDP